MVNLPSFDLIWHYVFAYWYIQVAVQQGQELGYHLNAKKIKNENLAAIQWITCGTSFNTKFSYRLPTNLCEVRKTETKELFTHQGLITFLNWFQEHKKGLAPLKIYQTNIRVNSIYRCHKNDNYYSFLLLWLFPGKKVFWEKLRREMRGKHHANSGCHKSDSCRIHCS